MVEIAGLTGLRPAKEKVADVTCPPYDVIKPGTKLISLLQSRKDSLYHVTLGNEPKAALTRLISEKILTEDSEPCFYVYEQTFGKKSRLGFFAAVQVTDYSQKNIIRHEKTFDDKVKGRIAITNLTGYTTEPIFLLTKSKISAVLEEIRTKYQPEYEFASDFAKDNDLHAIKNRVFRVLESSEEGQKLKQLIGENRLYIADGHHRYHAALLNNQTHCFAYICEKAKILAYNRVINGKVKFDDIKAQLILEAMPKFKAQKRNSFGIYTKSGTYLLKAKEVPKDVIGKLDCSILERELYPLLGLTHEMVLDHNHFDYYPGSDLKKMKECVDTGKYDIAVALHPVSIGQLMSVANAGLKNPEIVMPEKSTFFAPKILSGLFLYRHKFKQ